MAPLARSALPCLAPSIGLLPRLALVLVLWLAPLSFAHASQPYKPVIADPLLDSSRWRKLPELDGTDPRCLLEDAQGAIWFGTADGVARYDGVHWSHYALPDVPAELAAVNALCRSNNGTLYAGNNRGIFRFASGRWTQIFPRKPGTDASVRSIVAASDGSLWAAFGGHIVRIRPTDTTIFTNFTDAAVARRLARDFPSAKLVLLPQLISTAGMVPPEASPIQGRSRGLLEDRDGQVWYLPDPGNLVCFDPRNPDPFSPQAWRIIAPANGYRPQASDTMLQTADGLIWFGSAIQNGGINCYDPKTGQWRFFDLAGMFGTDTIMRSLVQTKDGALWAGGLSKLFRYQNGKWQLYRSPQIPVSSAYLRLLESQRGDLWLLGIGDQVQLLDYSGRRWRKYLGLNFRCETPDGRQWFVAGDDGVVCFDGGRWTRYGVEDGLMASPYAVLLTGRGELWAAGSEKGQCVVARFDGTRWTRMPRDGSLPPFPGVIDARAVASTPDGSLWFGSYVDAARSGLGGILRYDPALGAPEEARAWKVYRVPGHSTSFGFAVAGDGTLYTGDFGTFAKFDGQAWQALHLPGIRAVDALCSGRDGAVWIGTRGNGVYRYDGRRLVQYTIKDGLRENSVTALYSDRQNHLWVGTGTAVSHFDGQEWATDVFPADHVAMSREGGSFGQTADGTLWIDHFSREWMRRALPNGKQDPATLENFWTVRFKRSTESPQVEIVNAPDRVAQPGDAVIAWRGLDPWWLTRQRDLNYSLRLDDGPWSKFGAETNHVFLELPSGRHRVELRVRDEDLNIGTTPVAADFVVLPSVWRQPWFIALMAVLVGATALQTSRVFFRGQRLRRANDSLAAEIEEHKRTEAQLADNNERLEREIEARKQMEREVERTHKELMLASRQAGMAEVATSVLHNVGNVLNSVNVSATLIIERIRAFKLSGLGKVADLLRENAGQSEYLSTDAKGRQIPGYIKTLGDQLEAQRTATVDEMELLRRNVDHIKDIVARQQSYSRVAGVVETLPASELVEDALRMNASSLDRHAVQVERDFRDDPAVEIEKHKVLQILVNLIRNAKHACDESDRPDKRIVLRIVCVPGERFQVHVIDNGAGIRPENMTRIFQHGFTTRKEGHGFGLHSSANTAKELGGQITVSSDGPGTGAAFIVELPIHASTAASEGNA